PVIVDGPGNAHLVGNAIEKSPTPIKLPAAVHLDRQLARVGGTEGDAADGVLRPGGADRLVQAQILRFARIRWGSWESARDLLVQVSGQAPEVEKSPLHLRQR